MNVREQLEQAKTELMQDLLPLVRRYEDKTGLVVNEIDIERPYLARAIMASMEGCGESPIRDIKVRTNSNSI